MQENLENVLEQANLEDDKRLINPILNKKINEVVGKCFAINRMMDRGMSLLKVRWKMIQTANFLHPNVAHIFTGDKFADGLTEYQSKRNNESIYPATPAGDREYNQPIDFFKDMLKEMLELQDLLYDTYEVSKEVSDYTTKKIINKFIENLIEYVDIAQTLIDLANSYGSTPMGIALMDANIDEYFD